MLALSQLGIPIKILSRRTEDVFSRNFVDSSSPVEVDGDEGGRDGEVIHKGVELQHEPELVTSCYELKIVLSTSPL